MAKYWLLLCYIVTTLSTAFGQLSPYSLQSAVDALHRREAQLALKEYNDPSKYTPSLDGSAYWNVENSDDSFPPYRGSRQQLNKLLANYLARDDDEPEERENSIYLPSDYDEDSDDYLEERKRSIFRERDELPSQSVFREREMDMNSNLAEDFLREIDRQRNMEREEKYRESLHRLWDKYQQQENEIEEELFDEDKKKRSEPMQYYGPVMAKKPYPAWPVAFRAKRFPVAKRSPKPIDHHEHITEDSDKLNKDLAAIFGEPIEDKKKRSSDERVLKKREESTTKNPHGEHHDHDEEHDENDDDHDHEHDHEHEYEDEDDHDFDDSEEDDKKKKRATHKKKRSSTLEIIDEDQIIPSDLAILKKKKSSFQWSKYFGMDRRKKSYRAYDLDAKKKKKSDNDEYPLNNFRNHDGPVGLPSHEEHMNEGKLSNMDDKLKTIEDLIIDETVKYTGAHEGISNPDEIRKLKDHVVSRLATAYSLEKMRRALEKLKHSVIGQQHLLKNDVQGERETEDGPENDEDGEKKKRVAMKKEKVEFDNNHHEIESATQKVLPESPENGLEGPDDDKKKKKKKKNEITSNDVTDFEDEIGAGHFVEPLNEGYMGSNPLFGGPNHCLILESIEKRCRGVDLLSGDIYQELLTICSGHQLCYICGTTQTECDFQYLSEADSICGHNPECQSAARSALMILRGVPNPQLGPHECSKNSCLYRAMREFGL